MKAGVSAYIDSGAYIAFLVRSDLLHDEVVSLFASPPRAWYTSVLVVSETYSWFLHRLGEEAARTFRRLVEDLSGLEILDSDPVHRAATWEKLDRLRGHKLTYVDASSLVWLEKLGIGTVWGTDHHLGIEGADVVPSSSLP
ncbi:MAG: type II toxin-antitoxin system VapC family toxin [Gemmatimonadota bacterium]